jgi:hypothetical protein
MNVSGHGVQKHVERPAHPIPRKYVEPVMYLVERMSQQDRVVPPTGKRIADQLAEALQMKDFRRQPWMRQMNDQQACAMLDLETVKLGALVVLSLVMKADTTRGEAAKAYFSKIRQLLQMEPISIPADLEAHKAIAFAFLVG